jgi:hypothetical protein
MGTNFWCTLTQSAGKTNQHIKYKIQAWSGEDLECRIEIQPQTEARTVRPTRKSVRKKWEKENPIRAESAADFKADAGDRRENTTSKMIFSLDLNKIHTIKPRGHRPTSLI